MPDPRVTIAVLQRESFAHTQRSLERLYATAGAPFDLIYVDTGSPRSVRRLIDDEARRRGFRIIRRERFLTPNEARNLALASIDTEFVAFVDNDVIFNDGWLRRLLACADETGADLVGPLIFLDEPAFRKIHFAGGTAHIEVTESGNHLHMGHRFIDEVLSDEIAEQLRREPSELLELHCMLVRRSVFDRTGTFDEGLRSLNEHVDFCMLARTSGSVLMFEPEATACQLLPKLFPYDLQSLPFLFERWSRSNNRISVEHFRAKWQLAPGDPATEATYNWSNDRRLVMLRWLRPDIAMHGVRKVNRIVESWNRRGADRAATRV